MATRSTDLASRVREARDGAGLTQEALAKATGLTRDQVAAIELGRRDVSAREIYPLAQALRVRILDLLAIDELDMAQIPRYRNLPEGTDVAAVEAFARAYLRREASLRRVAGARN